MKTPSGLSPCRPLVVFGGLVGVALFFVVMAHRDQAAAAEDPVETTEPGQADLDEAMRVRITSDGFDRGITAEALRDINKTIELLQSAINKGLGNEDGPFAEQLLSESLIQRAAALKEVIGRRPAGDPRMAQLRRLAISDLRRVLAGANPPLSTQLMLAELLTGPEGDPHEARRLLQKFLDADPSAGLEDQERAKALALRAQLQGDAKKALADFNQAIELDPKNAGYRLARAVFLRGLGDLDEAIVEVAEIVSADPEFAPAWLLQGQLQQQRGDLEAAIASFGKASRLAPQAIEPLQARGEIRRQQGDIVEAIAEFTRVLQIRPGFVLTLLHRAEAYNFSEQFEAALADVDGVIQQQPGLVAAHRLRAQILANQDRLDEAIDEMEQLSAALPDDVEVKIQLGICYQINKQPRRAIAAYGDVLAKEPEHAGALRNRGDALLTLGQHAEAVADFTRALALDPENSTVLNNLAWVLSTSPDDPVRDGKRAIELATRACEITEFKQAHVLSTLAAAYAETGDFESARKWSQQAVEMNDLQHQEQLKQELESYRQDKPWRERQTAEAEDSKDDHPNEDEAEVPQDPTENPLTDAPAQSIDF